jgi:hypothetical protein
MTGKVTITVTAPRARERGRATKGEKMRKRSLLDEHGLGLPLAAFRRLLVVTLVAALGLVFNSAGTAVDGGGYPTLATVDGTAVGDTPSVAIGEVTAPLAVDSYNAGTSLEELVVGEFNTPTGNFKRTLWGYEAAGGGARILTYDIGPTGMGPLTSGPTCVPTHTSGSTSVGGRAAEEVPDGRKRLLQLLVRGAGPDLDRHAVEPSEGQGPWWTHSFVTPACSIGAPARATLITRGRT